MWLLYFLTAHWIADFVFQSSYTAINKSKHLIVLLKHVTIYMLVMCFFYGLYDGYYTDGILYNCLMRNVIFALTTFYTHFITDLITSKVNAKLALKDDKHYFFVMMGLDQLIHAFTLALTVEYLMGLHWFH